MNRRTADTNWGLGVIDKLGEARFFLRKMESTTSFTDSNYYASAFASACYSVTECLEARCAREPAQKAWWNNTRARLRADPVYKYFSAARGGDVHQGDSIVSGVGFSLVQTDDGQLATTEKVMLKNGGPEGATDSPAVEARAYLVSLLNAAREGFTQFGEKWDPSSALRDELSKFEEGTG
jgi:hypothetical protein